MKQHTVLGGEFFAGHRGFELAAVEPFGDGDAVYVVGVDAKARKVNVDGLRNLLEACTCVAS